MSMLMQVSPILAALRRHRSAVILLILEISLTMAVLGNLIFIVHGTLDRSRTPTGVMEGDIGVVQSISVIGQGNAGNVGSNLALLQQLPGVVAAAYGGVPLWYAQRDRIFLDSARTQSVGQAYEFMGSQGYSRTLGLRIIRGRDLDDDLIPAADKTGAHTIYPVLVTDALAAKLFPGQDALGKLFYDGNASFRIEGIAEHLRGQITGKSDDDDSIVIEARIGAMDMGGAFTIRSQPGQLGPTLRAAADTMQKANPGHVQNKVYSMQTLRSESFRGDLALGNMLIVVMVILVVVTALGVSGLASFWVQQRRRQIGMRRALGATRGDILQYFQLENFLIVSHGVVLGAIAAYALNRFLMQHFEVEQLPFGYIIVGAATVWILGQLAVLGPALRAAAVPPVVATRSI